MNAVRAFAAAARHQSFSRAAEELHVSHSAVSRHVKLLEERLGVLLFERRTRQSLLTPAGRAFYEQVSEALTQIANAATALTRNAAQRKVTINVRPSFAVRWLIPRLPDFMALHPDIKPDIVTSTLPPDPSRETFDVVIRRGHAGWSPHVQPTVLLEDDLLLVAAPSLLHSVPLETIHDLARHTLLSGRTLQQRLARLGGTRWDRVIKQLADPAIRSHAPRAAGRRRWAGRGAVSGFAAGQGFVQRAPDLSTAVVAPAVSPLLLRGVRGCGG